jgi:hypothetical protein
MFIAALFTIATLWKQPRSPKLTNGLRKCDIYMHGILFTHNEECNFVGCR